MIVVGPHWWSVTIGYLQIASHYLSQDICHHIAAPKSLSSPTIRAYNRNSLQWRHNEHDNVSNHQPRDCLFNRLFRRKWKKTSKLRVTGLCVGNSPGTGEFPSQIASNPENVSIWWHHHVSLISVVTRSMRSINVCEYLIIKHCVPCHFLFVIRLINRTIEDL